MYLTGRYSHAQSIYALDIANEPPAHVPAIITLVIFRPPANVPPPPHRWYFAADRVPAMPLRAQLAISLPALIPPLLPLSHPLSKLRAKSRSVLRKYSVIGVSHRCSLGLHYNRNLWITVIVKLPENRIGSQSLKIR